MYYTHCVSSYPLLSTAKCDQSSSAVRNVLLVTSLSSLLLHTLAQTGRSQLTLWQIQLASSGNLSDTLSDTLCLTLPAAEPGQGHGAVGNLILGEL